MSTRQMGKAQREVSVEGFTFFPRDYPLGAGQSVNCVLIPTHQGANARADSKRVAWKIKHVQRTTEKGRGVTRQNPISKSQSHVQ